jgi:hypothetical protein
VESKLGPLGTSAIYWPIVPAPGDCQDGEFGGMNWQGKPKYSEKTCPDATLSTTNPTWPDPGLNPGRRDAKPATNRFSYGAAICKCKVSTKLCSLGVIILFCFGEILGKEIRVSCLPQYLMANIRIISWKRSRSLPFQHLSCLPLMTTIPFGAQWIN